MHGAQPRQTGLRFGELLDLTEYPHSALPTAREYTLSYLFTVVISITVWRDMSHSLCAVESIA